MPIYELDERPILPPGNLAGPDGLLAVGGDLSSARLLQAYSQGVFPWPCEGMPLMWFCPDPRLVLLPGAMRISRSLRARLGSGRFEVRFDSAFREVVEGCAATPRQDQDGTWITPPMREAYTELHRMGLAHSVESWQDGRLVGGLYGVSLGAAFFGESMFSLVSDASKVALAMLSRRLQHWGFRFIDCQMTTPHLLSLGGQEWPRRRFLESLDEALLHPTHQGSWSEQGARELAGSA